MAAAAGADGVQGGGVVQFLHPGMPKAASTWLQNVFFAGHPQLAVLGPEDRERDLAKRFLELTGQLTFGSDLQDDAPVVGELAGLVRELAARRPGARVGGLSHEGLLGEWPAPRNTDYLARTLARAFPGAKVFIAVREQRAAIVSAWREYVRMGGTLSFPRFLWDPAAGGAPLVHPFETAVLGSVLYAPVVRAWRHAFGADRVKVMPMKRLRRDAAGFVRELCAFLGVDEWQPEVQQVNVQLSDPALALLRRGNHLFHTRQHARYGWKPVSRVLQWFGRGRSDDPLRENPYYERALISSYVQRWLAKRVMPRLDRLGLSALDRGIDHFARLPDEGRRHVEARIAADNRELRELVDWDPAEFGYLLDA
jgi:hypothetical protein